MHINAADNKQVIVGLGLTGLSCARYLARNSMPFVVVDSRQNPPGLEAFKAEFPTVALTLGEISQAALAGAERIIVSPGVALQEPAIEQAIKAGVRVCGDIDLFCEAANAPIIAITGSNGKSTVTSLVGAMVEKAGLTVAVGGNIGIPALDLLMQDNVDIYVLELSSFQLERAGAINAEVATVLNLSADHMDRYSSLLEYQQAKHRIFRGAKQAVVNRNDPASKPLLAKDIPSIEFGRASANTDGFTVIEDSGESYLTWGLEKLIAVSDIKLFGHHNIDNALAALALGRAVNLPIEAMLGVLREFGGLPHRCQWVAELDAVNYYNDSKGTNVGATTAAVAGLADRANKIILIAGGEGKGADFSRLLPVLSAHARAVVVIGEAADDLQQLLEANLTVLKAADMRDAVDKARVAAESGDAVLLSPACASFDMFRDYQHRGDVFTDCVQTLLSQPGNSAGGQR